jgi:hypothetical protein
VTIVGTLTRQSAIFVFLVALSGLAMLSGCGVVGNIQKRETVTQLEAVTNTYRKLMRWGHYDQAAEYLKGYGEQSLAEPELKDMARFKVTSYTFADQLVADTLVDARVTAYVEFYDIDTGVTKAARDEQFWWYDKEAGRWYLGSPMLNFAAVEN